MASSQRHPPAQSPGPSRDAFNVGSDVEALCRTCGDVWHVVVAKLGDKITKVECKQCGKQHRFKPTGDAPAANLAPPKRTVASSPRPRPARTSSSGKPSSGTTIVLDPDKPARDYAMTERFEVGEQLRHKKFGPGIVAAVEDDKIRVVFNDGSRMLLHGRS
jgi:hypothetical protein